jgi:hypothetical protein
VGLAAWQLYLRRPRLSLELRGWNTAGSHIDFGLRVFNKGGRAAYGIRVVGWVGDEEVGVRTLPSLAPDVPWNTTLEVQTPNLVELEEGAASQPDADVVLAPLTAKATWECSVVGVAGEVHEECLAHSTTAAVRRAEAPRRRRRAVAP